MTTFRANGDIDPEIPAGATLAYARILDDEDPLKSYRSEFIIPTVADLKRPTLKRPSRERPSSPCIYLCGNSLGLPPRRIRYRIETYMTQWSTKGVTGHFVTHADSELEPFLHIDDHAASLMAPLVGAHQEEVAVMDSLTANLHFMMASFYRPTAKQHKILLEGKAFPSDHYAIESQVSHHGFDPKSSMILLEPEASGHTLTTTQIITAIEEHKDALALILLPGVQFYTGQFFDIRTITAFAHSHNVTIGWDLAHAVGNVELSLHDWGVDFAVWCTYKYLNAGPGATAGLFVHGNHSKVDMSAETGKQYRPRLTGWWGADKESRFLMDNKFIPRPGAAGFQMSNPNALGLAAVVGALELFNEATMTVVRKKSLGITLYLEFLLREFVPIFYRSRDVPFEIITPSDPKQRGAQLSIKLKAGMLDHVLRELEKNGVVVDERKPDVIRVAPAPLYNSFEDVLRFCDIFREALESYEQQQYAGRDVVDHEMISKSGN